MQRQDIEEKFAKCYVCANGLSYMDNLLYGNRCVSGKTDINMLETVKDRKELLRELRKM